MITIVLTNRNRNLRIIKNCLDSLANQTSSDFKIILVDYGSAPVYVNGLIQLVFHYHFVELICYQVHGQLWNKSKAINIALKQTSTPYFFVGDIDMLFRHDFIEKILELKKEDKVIYFQVGVLSQSESTLNKSFEDYVIKHKTNDEATGMTLYPTELLKSIKGYDEFYHGWGAEDTDVHIRLKLGGHKVVFYDEALFILHQWHSKNYRSKESMEPFHSYLERINHQYIQFIVQKKENIANAFFDWGKLPERTNFVGSNKMILLVTNQVSEIEALLYGFLDNYNGQNVVIEVKEHPKYKNVKNEVKKFLGKKHLKFYDFQTINNMLLGHIITRYRDKYYEYEWNKKMNTIELKIAL